MNASMALLRDRSRRSSISENSIQWFYEKSRLHYLVPIMLLTGYSVLGGYIFYTIEQPNEIITIKEKSSFIDRQKEEIFDIVIQIRIHLERLHKDYGNNTREYNLHKRHYRRWTMNRLRTKTYWYSLSTYYLTEHEAHKALALRPKNPEYLWKEHFASNYGRIHALQNYTEQLARRCWELGEESFEKWSAENMTLMRVLVNNATMKYAQRFERLTGLNHVLSPVWTFWNAMFLAGNHFLKCLCLVTTYTTIGYGNITAKTKLGRLAAMVYAVIGIPLMLMILHKLGRICLNVLDRFWEAFDFFFCTGYSMKERNSDEDRITEMPLVLAIGVAFGYMFFCAAIFLYFEEDWDYFKSFYFFFCSLTTIGYGDVTPTKSEDMFTIFVFILVGLSLVSMCINVIQLKLEKLFEEILLMLMEEYSADPEARPLRGERISVMDMWRVWRRRKERRQKEKKGGSITKEGGDKASAAATAAKDAANRAGENLARVFPFMRRRERQVIIEQISHRLRQKHKATQTDMPWYLTPVFEAETETSSSSSPPTPKRISPPSYSRSPTRAQPEIFSALTSMQPSEREDTLSSSSISDSVLSEPLPGSSEGPGGVMYPPNFDPTRRWTFVETGKAPRGQPRGLVVPPSFASQRNVQQTEVKRLIAELDARLRSARAILTPSPYTSSSPSVNIRPRLPPGADRCSCR